MGGAREDLQQDVRNEIRSQMVPGYGANLHQAVARIPAMPFGRAMQLSGSHHMEWIGDAAKTFERVLHTRRDPEDLWGENCKPGWRIPETYHDEKGVVRKRADRHKGVLLVFSVEDYMPDSALPLPAGEEMIASACTVDACEEGCTQFEWEKCTVLKHEGNDKYTVRIHADEDISRIAPSLPPRQHADREPGLILHGDQGLYGHALCSARRHHVRLEGRRRA